MAFSLGCDIGGTFTDFLLLDEETGEVEVHKRLTRPGDPSRAVSEGVKALGATRPGYLPRVGSVVHGTTLVSNAVIERKGARTGLLTTEGFRDVLEIGREKRYDAHDLQIAYPEPLVPRPLRLEVPERVHASGRVLKPLDEGGARRAVGRLLERGVESVAVCLLHAYGNAVHELRVGALIAEMAPGLPVSLSSEVLPEIKEYERCTTTVINAYAQPLAARYLAQLEERLRALGFSGDVRIMLSGGGITSVETARRFPVRIIESGPAAGVIAAAHYARLAGLDQVLSFDMGGTTAKMCLVTGGRVAKTTTFEIARVHRFKRGSGIPVRVPVVDLMEIGAGGGSIAKVSGVGTLQVGPESAAADPGPACYGQGGTLPTVSDADLLLGYLNPGYFLGGQMPLVRDAAERAVRDVVAKPLGLSVVEAAWGIHSIVNENMVSAAKVYVTEHGQSPENCTLVAFGGAGPVHACDLARRLGVRKVLVPPRAGVASAFGLLVAPISYETVRTHRVRLAQARCEELERLFAEMEKEARQWLPRDLRAGSIRFERSADTRYAGQGYDTNVSLPSGRLTEDLVTTIRAAFDRTYSALYGRVYDDLELEIINLRLLAAVPRQAAIGCPPPPSTRPPQHEERLAFCPYKRDIILHAVYHRLTLPPDFEIEGPAIVEESEATTVLGQGARLRVDAQGSLLMAVSD
ncbi:MAG: hydantoinase/oxoprolinase family protein [Candidatus Rokubacteria bacterium]|nr:hydantoinase/oxoprolinase family protein [Candidatus Rokubacteria bacterium]